MVIFSVKSLSDDCAAQGFHAILTLPACPKQGFSGVADSKLRGETGFSGNGKLMEISQGFACQLPTAQHGLKCGRRKIFWNDGDFRGSEWRNGGLWGQILTSLNTRHRQPLHFGGKEGGCEPPAMPFCPTAALPRKRRERGSLPRTVRGAAFACTHLLYIKRKPPFITLTILQSEVAKVLKIYATDERRKNILTTREKMFRIFVSGKQCASRASATGGAFRSPDRHCHSNHLPRGG